LGPRPLLRHRARCRCCDRFETLYNKIRFRHPSIIPSIRSMTESSASKRERESNPLTINFLVAALSCTAGGHATTAPPLHCRPRFPTLALFGRWPLECLDNLGIPASENLAQKRSLILGRIGLFPGRRSNRSNCHPQSMKRQGYGGASKSALEFFSKTGPLILDYDCCSGTEKWSHLRCRRHTDARREWWASISTTPPSLMTVLSTQGRVLSGSGC
jgi:hypothetical protein